VIRRGARPVAAALLALLAIAWCVTLFPAGWSAPPPGSAPSWRDSLVIEINTMAQPVTLQPAAAVWRADGAYDAQLPFAYRTTRARQSIVLPIGAHPLWRGATTVEALRLDQLRHAGDPPLVTTIRVARRPPWALDAPVALACAAIFGVVPPWRATIMLTVMLLCGAVALLLPHGDRRRSLYIWAPAAGGMVGAYALATQLALTGEIVALAGGRDERAAQLLAPTYDESPRTAALLHAAAAQLPDAPALVLDIEEWSYLSYRARYLFYPRQVDALPVRRMAAEDVRRLLERRYGILITRDALEAPPLPGWERFGEAGAAPQIWYRPGDAATTAPAPEGWAATMRLALALALVFGAGWGIAGALGFGGAARAGWGWLLGTGMLTATMLLMERAGVAWSLAGVGGALLLIAFAGVACSREGGARLASDCLPADLPAWGMSAGATLLLAALLALLLAAQATLLPFTDQDTWRIWGLLGKGYALDGNTYTIAGRYRDIGLGYYPPGQPLLLAWGYTALGGIAERPVKVIFPLWYAAGLAILWGACRARAGAPAAAGWTLLLATAPVVLDHATLVNADLPLGVALLAAAAALARWVHGGAWRMLLASALAVLVAASIKVDGLYLGVGMLCLAAALRGGIAGWLFGVAAIVAGLLVGGAIAQRDPLPLLATLQGGFIPAGGAAAREIGAEMLLGTHNSARGLHGGGYGALWLIAGAVLSFNLRRIAADRAAIFLALATLGGVGAYAGLLMLHSASATSIERYLLHVAPIAALAAAWCGSAPPQGAR
jgi:hypothetical protein